VLKFVLKKANTEHVSTKQNTSVKN